MLSKYIEQYEVSNDKVKRHDGMATSVYTSNNEVHRITYTHTHTTVNVMLCMWQKSLLCGFNVEKKNVAFESKKMLGVRLKYT